MSGIRYEANRDRKGGTSVRITVIKLPRTLGRMVMAILSIFSGKKPESGDAA